MGEPLLLFSQQGSVSNEKLNEKLGFLVLFFFNQKLGIHVSRYDQVIVIKFFLYDHQERKDEKFSEERDKDKQKNVEMYPSTQ